MRLRHPDGTTVHLSYCSNVHPAEDVDGIVMQLQQYAGPVRRAVGADVLGVGLWIPAGAARSLAADPAGCARLRAALAADRLEVVTLNGFPYEGFHDPVVKRAVYRPDWTDPDRLAYTLDLARVLAELLPDDVATGTISTLPLGWREGWSRAATRASLGALTCLAGELAMLQDRTGRTIRVGLEPEPGCIVERTGQAAELLARAGDGVAGWVGVCLDACHLAVQFEDPAGAVAALASAGVPVVKAQVSTALRATSPAEPTVREALERFVEPRFLHQTRVQRPDGWVEGMDDLDEALAPGGGLADDGEWRVHFHAPVHWTGSAPGEQTTQRELCDTLAVLAGGPAPLTTHLDVETYTWTVLPAGQRPDGPAGLVDGLARELRWTRDHLTDLGLKPLEEHP